MPTIGPAFEPLPEDPEDRAAVVEPARRTPGAAEPRRHPRLQPLVRPRGAARAAGADPDRPRAEGGPVNAERRERQVLVGGRDRRGRGARPGSTSPPAAPPMRRRRPRIPARPALARPRRPRRDRPAVLALGARRRRLRAGVSRETLARALATPESRERFTERYGIDDAELARAIRAGLLRAVDDAEEAGALSPLLAGPLRRDAEERSRSTRRSN